MGAPATHALNDGVKGHVYFKHVVQFDARCLHGISLRNGAGEAVKQKPRGAVCLGNTLFDEVDDQVVANQTASVHDFLGFNP